jgi:hypothetical protein
LSKGVLVSNSQLLQHQMSIGVLTHGGLNI